MTQFARRRSRHDALGQTGDGLLHLSPGPREPQPRAVDPLNFFRSSGCSLCVRLLQQRAQPNQARAYPALYSSQRFAEFLRKLEMRQTAEECEFDGLPLFRRQFSDGTPNPLPALSCRGKWPFRRSCGVGLRPTKAGKARLWRLAISTQLWCRPPAYKGGQSPPLEVGHFDAVVV